jgi:hypothetical protein
MSQNQTIPESGTPAPIPSPPTAQALKYGLIQRAARGQESATRTTGDYFQHGFKYNRNGSGKGNARKECKFMKKQSKLRNVLFL